MKIIIVIILSLIGLYFLIKAVVFSFKNMICYTKNPAIRKRYKKAAMHILKANLKAAKKTPFPVFIELHFNSEKYEDYYVEKGLFKTVDFLFETVTKNLKEVEHMKGDSDIDIYKINIQVKNDG